MILDLPDPGTDPAALRLGLDPEINLYSRDTAWFGLARWREMIAQFFDPPCPGDTLARIDSVSIRAVSPTGDAPPRLAIWLVAWLAGQLGWRPQGHPDRVGNRLAATFLGPSGPVAVEIVTEVDPTALAPRLNGATLTARGPDGVATFRLDRPASRSSEVDVEVLSPTSCSLPRSILAPELDSPRRLAYALESARDDPPFRHALPHALWLLSGEGSASESDAHFPSFSRREKVAGTAGCKGIPVVPDDDLVRVGKCKSKPPHPPLRSTFSRGEKVEVRSRPSPAGRRWPGRPDEGIPVSALSRLIDPQNACEPSLLWENGGSECQMR